MLTIKMAVHDDWRYQNIKTLPHRDHKDQETGKFKIFKYLKHHGFTVKILSDEKISTVNADLNY